MGPRWLGADLTRDFCQTGAEVVVGQKWLGAEVTRGRGGSGPRCANSDVLRSGVLSNDTKASIADKQVQCHSKCFCSNVHNHDG